MSTRTTWLGALAVGAAAALTAPAAQALTINYVMHSSTSNTFWAAVNRGFMEACEQIEADCQMLVLRNDGDLQEQLTNFNASIAQGVDGIITTLVDDTIFDDAVQAALDAGIPVLAANVDDTEGAAGSPRLSFIGQDLEQAGYELAKGLSEMFPAEGPIHVVIGVADFSQSWATQRGNGVARFMDDYIAAHPEREVTYEKIESGLDLSVVGSRVAAYVQSRPETTAYFDVGYWHAGAAAALRDLGIEPGKVLLAGFDLVPVVLDEMDAGYVQLTVDQQPYLQGFLPVMQLYLMDKYGLSAWDVNTGKALIYPSDVAAVRQFADEGVR
ncbi:MAG: sugar ABC transporter substrate-binding protein [Alphaproteobacteria bacterium]